MFDRVRGKGGVKWGCCAERRKWQQREPGQGLPTCRRVFSKKLIVFMKREAIAMAMIGQIGLKQSARLEADQGKALGSFLKLKLGWIG